MRFGLVRKDVLERIAASRSSLVFNHIEVRSNPKSLELMAIGLIVYANNRVKKYPIARWNNGSGDLMSAAQLVKLARSVADSLISGMPHSVTVAHRLRVWNVLRWGMVVPVGAFLLSFVYGAFLDASHRSVFMGIGSLGLIISGLMWMLTMVFYYGNKARSEQHKRARNLRSSSFYVSEIDPLFGAAQSG